MTNSQLYLILMSICYAQLWNDNKMLLFVMGTLAFILGTISRFV